MSLKQTIFVWERSRSRLAARLVLLALADFADDDGQAWPSVATIARKTALGERTVHDALRELVRLGELAIEIATGPKGVNRYRLLVPASGVVAATLPPAPQSAGAPSPAPAPMAEWQTAQGAGTATGADSVEGAAVAKGAGNSGMRETTEGGAASATGGVREVPRGGWQSAHPNGQGTINEQSGNERAALSPAAGAAAGESALPPPAAAPSSPAEAKFQREVGRLPKGALVIRLPEVAADPEKPVWQGTFSLPEAWREVVELVVACEAWRVHLVEIEKKWSQASWRAFFAEAEAQGAQWVGVTIRVLDFSLSRGAKNVLFQEVEAKKWRPRTLKLPPRVAGSQVPGLSAHGSGFAMTAEFKAWLVGQFGSAAEERWNEATPEMRGTLLQRYRREAN